MLIDINSREAITRIPHRKDFEVWKAKLTEAEHSAIVEELNSRIGTDEVHTSSWIPGADWTDTAFEPIYSACNRDVDAAAKFFGLLLWVVMMEREETWAFGRYERSGIPIRGLTYFRVDLP